MPNITLPSNETTVTVPSSSRFSFVHPTQTPSLVITTFSITTETQLPFNTTKNPTTTTNVPSITPPVNITTTRPLVTPITIDNLTDPTPIFISDIPSETDIPISGDGLNDAQPVLEPSVIEPENGIDQQPPRSDVPTFETPVKPLQEPTVQELNELENPHVEDNNPPQTPSPPSKHSDELNADKKPNEDKPRDKPKNEKKPNDEKKPKPSDDKDKEKASRTIIVVTNIENGQLETYQVYEATSTGWRISFSSFLALFILLPLI